MERKCSSDIGACVAGTQTCQPSGKWGGCLGAKLPTDEVCDGVDNDCDTQIDDGLAAPECELVKGVCLGSKKRCMGSQGFSECGKSEYGSDYEVEETRCDKLDNDCDGKTDEDNVCGDQDQDDDQNNTDHTFGLWSCSLNANYDVVVIPLALLILGLLLRYRLRTKSKQ